MNKIQESLNEIHVSEQLKEKTKQKIYLTQNKKSLKVPIGMICCLVALIIAIIFPFKNKDYTYISIDVNPSIEFVVDRNNKVIDINSYNEDGTKVIENIEVKGKDYLDAMDILLSFEEMRAYCKGNYQLVLTVTSKSENRIAEVKNNLQQLNYQATIETCHYDLVEEAHQHHLSIGKYCKYLTLKQYDSTITVNHCHEMTMEEIESEIVYHQNCHSFSQKSHHRGHHK